MLAAYARVLQALGVERRHSHHCDNLNLLPIVVWILLATEPWIESSPPHFPLAAAAAVAHSAARFLHHRAAREHCNMPGLEDDEDDFPMKLGLRY